MKVGEISEKVHEIRVNWYGHVMRRVGGVSGETSVGDGIRMAITHGRRRKGRPKRREGGVNSTNKVLTGKGVSGEWKRKPGLFGGDWAGQTPYKSGKRCRGST